MINRTLSVASAAILGLLTFTSINIFFDRIAYAADDCRTSPGAEAPAGGHWRYRLEKGSGRKCWYLSGVSDATSASETKQPDAPKAAAVEPKEKSAPMQPAVADARAELTKPETRQLNDTVWPPLQAPPTTTNNSANLISQNPQDSTTLAQRWPEPNSVQTSDNEFAEKMRMAASDPAPTINPVPPEPLSPREPQDDSTLSPMRVLLVTVIGALALVGFLMRGIVSYLAKRRKRNAPRRQIWDDAYQQPASPSAQHGASVRPDQPARRARPLYDDQEAREEIEFLLRRAAQRDRQKA